MSATVGSGRGSDPWAHASPTSSLKSKKSGSSSPDARAALAWAGGVHECLGHCDRGEAALRSAEPHGPSHHRLTATVGRMPLGQVMRIRVLGPSPRADASISRGSSHAQRQTQIGSVAWYGRLLKRRGSVNLPLLAELKRRRVFRALVGYGIAAFAVLQIIEPVMHGLHWPEAVLSFVVVALALGFPLVVALAWVFDVKAGRIERTVPAAGLRGVRLAAVITGIGVLAAAPGLAWYLFLRPGVRSSPSDEAMRAKLDAVPPASDIRAVPSIAVLPLVNLSRDPDQEYFADGLAEELLNLLAKVPGLHVAGRTSSFSFKGKSEDLRAIGQKLNVKTVLEGSVQRSGDRLRINTQLINAADGYHLWSESYDRKLTDVFAVQDEIARSVVSALKVHLLPAAGARPAT